MDTEGPAASSGGGKIWVREMEYFNGRLKRIKAFVLVSWRSLQEGVTLELPCHMEAGSTWREIRVKKIVYHLGPPVGNMRAAT